TISQRVEAAGRGFTAVVCAVPRDRMILAVIRTLDCDSRDGAASSLDAMTHALEAEIAARGDTVLAGEIQEPAI
ncbi:MAG: hypothetical protein ACXWGU_12720, partial [Usitatibacter sp.]